MSALGRSITIIIGALMRMMNMNSSGMKFSFSSTMPTVQSENAEPSFSNRISV